MSVNEEKFIQRDRMRFTKNTLSSGLALLAILFNILYFVSIYKSDVGSYYYNILIGASILYNLIFMLVVGALQIARIFFLPMRAHAAVIKVNKQEVLVMQTAQFVRIVVYLAASAACCFVAGVVGIRKSQALAAHMATLEQKAA